MRFRARRSSSRFRGTVPCRGKTRVPQEEDRPPARRPVDSRAAAFLLRKPAGVPGVAVAQGSGAVAAAPPVYSAHTPAAAAGKNGALLNALKEELFALESDKLTGAVSPAEYAETKAALETVLKRALKKNA